MTTIIAGSRDITYMPLLEEAIERAPFKISKVYCGMARGVDTLGWSWATKNGIPVQNFPADWENEYQRRVAGLVRNKAMIDAGAQALLALWDGQSTGTKDMIDRAKRAGIAVYVVTAIKTWVTMKEEVWPPMGEGILKRVIDGSAGASPSDSTTS